MASELVQFSYIPLNLRGVEYLPDIQLGDLKLKNIKFDTYQLDQWYDIYKPWKGITVLYNDIIYSHNNSDIYCHPIIHIVEWKDLRSSPLFGESIKVLYFPEMDKIRIIRAMKIIYSRYFLKDYLNKYMKIIENMTINNDIDLSLPIIYQMYDLHIKNIQNYECDKIYFTITHEVEYSTQTNNIKKSNKSTNKFALLADSDDSDDSDSDE